MVIVRIVSLSQELLLMEKCVHHCFVHIEKRFWRMELVSLAHHIRELPQITEIVLLKSVLQDKSCRSMVDVLIVIHTHDQTSN